MSTDAGGVGPTVGDTFAPGGTFDFDEYAYVPVATGTLNYPTTFGDVDGAFYDVGGSVYFVPDAPLGSAPTEDGTIIDADGPLFGTSGNETITAPDDDGYVIHSGSTASPSGSGSDTLNGGAGDDHIYGGDGNDTVYAGGGDDVISGGTGNDLLFGEDDADTFIVQDAFGNDTIYGGTTVTTGVDWDVLDLTGVTVPLTIDYDGDGYGTITDGTFTISFYEIEEIRLSDAGDMLSAGADTVGITVTGGAGDDTIWAGLGDDTLSGGLGNDEIFGDAGNDTITGGAGDDDLGGDAGDDQISGGDGDDWLQGNEGTNTLDGGAGDDVFEVFTDQGGTDTIIGGETEEVSGDSVTFTGGGGITVNLTGAESGTFTTGTGAGIFSEIEYFEGSSGPSILDASGASTAISGVSMSGFDTIISSDHGDTWAWSTSNDVTFVGGSGEDSVSGGTGHDRLIGGASDDSLEGGAGNDTLIGDGYTGDGTNLLVNGSFEDTTGMNTASWGYEATGAIIGWTTTDGTDRIDIHNDSRAGISATDGTNWLDMDGDLGDQLTIGQDVAGIVPGEVYVLTFDAGDFANGDEGTANDNTIEVIWNGETIAVIDPGEGALSSYEFVVVGGAGDGSDRLEFTSGGYDGQWGASLDNVSLELGVSTDSGDDTLDGGMGDDLMVGGEGQDTFTFGDSWGADIVYGGGAPIEGNEDTLDFSAVTLSGVNVSFTDWEDGTASEGSNTLTFENIERVVGSDQADVIDASLDGSGVELFGGGGSDTIAGGTGDDLIEGGAGSDASLFGGAGMDTIIGGSGADNMSGGADGDTFVITGGIDNDTIDGGETVATGTDWDIIDLSGVSIALTVVYTGDESGTISDGTDTITFTGIEHIWLGDGDDIVDATAATGGISIWTEGGDDMITAGAGDDQIAGGAGDDMIVAGAGTNTIWGDSGSDTLVVSDAGGTTTFFGSEDGGELDALTFANDTGTSGATVTFAGWENGSFTFGGTTGTFYETEVISTTQYDDVIDASLAPSDQIINSFGGDDIITGGDGNDTVSGGDGDDTFIVNNDFGTDVFVGGEAGETLGDTIDASAVTDGGVSATWTSGDAGTLTSNVHSIGFSEVENFTLTQFGDIVDASLATENVTIDGGDGDDNLLGGAGDDTFTGGLGDDRLEGGAGNDTLDGGDGDDDFYLGDGFGTDTLIGGTTGEVDGDRLYANSMSADTTVTFAGDNDGTLGDGTNTASFTGIDTFYTGDGDDVFDGTNDSDGFTVNTGRGDDVIFSGAGDDTIFAGNNSDDIHVNDQSGTDTIAAGSGADALYFTDTGTGQGVSVVWSGEDAGGYGFDGSAASGTFTGIDQVEGSANDDSFDSTGSLVGNTASGHEGDDMFLSGSGDDTFCGDDGDDTYLLGDGWGDDSFYGGSAGETDGDLLDASSTTTGVTYTLTGDGTGTATDGTNTLAFDDVEDLTFGSGNDIYDGSAGTGNLRVEAGDGDDTLISGAGNETFLGGEGHDTFVVGDDDGTDVIGGGDSVLDTDTLDFEDASTGGVTVTYSSNTSGTYDFDATSAGGSFSGIDAISGTDGDDSFDASASLSGATLAGEAGDDSFFGGAGDDDFSGGAGSDTFTIDDNGGTDIIDGGAGSDILDFQDVTSTSGVNVVYSDSTSGTWNWPDTGAGGSFTGIEQLDGTALGDTIDGSAATGTLIIDGQDGDDTISGGSNDDFIYAGAGDDVVTGGGGDDLLAGEAGDDTLTGGDGDDLIDGGAGDDALFGGDGNDTITAAGGTDTVDAGAGDDTISVGNNDTSNVTIVGGESDETVGDTISFTGDGAGGGTTIIFTGDEAGTFDDGVNSGSFSEIEIIQTYGDDDIVDASSDTAGVTINSGGGEDRITGGGGDDVINAGDGSDTIATGQGSDTVDAGAGDDTITVGGAGVSDTTIIGGETGEISGDHLILTGDGAGSGVEVFYTANEAGTFDDGTNTGTFSEIETLETGDGADTVDASASSSGVFIETGDNDDIALGGAGDDTLSGGAGDDRLTGGAGVDTLLGGDGDDVFILTPNWGDDTITGGEAGETIGDLLDASALSDGVLITYSGDEAGTVTDGTNTANFSEIEAIEGTDFDDTVDASSDSAGVTIDTGAGDDTLFAGSGDDTLNAGEGNDTLIGGQGGTDTLAGQGGDDDFTVGGAGPSITTIIGGETGETLGDSLTLTGDGATGGTTVTYASGDSGTFDDGTNSGSFSEIETVTTSDNDDTIDASGSSSGVSLNAADGNDTITGSDHDDRIDGGAGADTISGGAGDDTIDGGSGDDVIAGGAGDDIIDGGADDDVISGGAGHDTLTGGSGNDTFAISDGDDTNTIVDFDMLDDDLDGFTNDQLDLSGLTDSEGNPLHAGDISVSDDGSGNAVITAHDGTTITLQGVDPGALDAPTLFSMGIPCFTEGTLIDTAKGPRKIEEIGLNDLVRTVTGELVPVIWRDKSTLQDCPEELRPIEIKAGALGDHEAVRLSPQHRVVIGPRRRFAPVRWLAEEGGGAFRVMMGQTTVTYHHLMLPRHAVIRANGCEVESFYPGPEALGAISVAARARLFGLEPTFARIITMADAERYYGPLARPRLKRHELDMLVNNRWLPPAPYQDWAACA